MPVIQTEDLEVCYGKRRAISALTLAVPEGAVGLLGPNGAGKSTFLKTLLGFLKPTRGRAAVMGTPVQEGPHRLRQRIGYFPERSVFVPGLSSVEAVALAGELGGLGRTDALVRAHEVLWFTGLGDARYRPLEEFSTGMRQRTKLALALVHDPDLLLLDEPTSGLDPSGRRQMLELIREVGKRGVSVVLSTHLLHDVEQVCDGIIVLSRGRLVREGRLSSLRRRPGWSYEVRVREARPGALKRTLDSRGLAVSEDRDGVLRIAVGEPSTRFLFEAARSAGAEIRELRRFERSLEEEFQSAVDGRDTRAS